MLALTVKQPWADAIARGLKPVENRSWAPWARIIGRDLAIHAAKRPAPMEEYRERAGHAARPLEEMPLGAIVAVVRVVGALNVETGEVVGELSSEQLTRVTCSPWTCGPWAWLLEDVRALSPVTCRGAQGLWVVPDQVRCAI